MHTWPLALLLLASPTRAEAAGDLYVLAINGGGDRLDNFASHLAHLHQLVDLLDAAGVPRDHITVLASDGQNPAPDLATREPDPEHAWLLKGTVLDSLVRDLLGFESSLLPGIDLRPATRASLTRTIGELRGRLQPGDTLLLYVTDHGTESRRDPIENRITLWGGHESISVRKLGTLLARLAPEVRVVSLMSQCYSGGFAYLHEAREHARVPSGATCGYFSSTPDRPSYGCYPEVRGQKAVGHSFEFLSALARRGRFPVAHAEILLTDDTPDIPLRSSDVYLAELLARKAPGRRGDTALADTLLRQALATGATTATAAFVDRIAARYGIERPTSFAELDEHLQRLFGLLDDLGHDARVWEAALGELNRASLDAFLASRPAWRERVRREATEHLDPAVRRALVTQLLAELYAFVATDSARLAQADRLTSGLGTTEDIAYRTEIRVAALFRIRFAFISLASRQWLAQHPGEAKALAALEQCEDLALVPKTPLPSVPAKPDAGKLPALTEDRRRAADLRPGWLGVTFVPVSRGRREKLHLPGGAAAITSIASRSPAAEVGLRRGDIVLGTPDRPFASAYDLRPFITAADRGVALPLEILRGQGRLVLSPVVREAPAAR